jgi:hypothetical protein
MDLDHLLFSLSSTFLQPPPLSTLATGQCQSFELATVCSYTTLTKRNGLVYWYSAAASSAVKASKLLIIMNKFLDRLSLFLNNFTRYKTCIFMVHFKTPIITDVPL